MEGWQIASTLVAVFIAISQFYVWVWPVLRRNRKEKQEVNTIIKNTLKNTVNSAKTYAYHRLGKLQEIIDDVRVSGKLRIQLIEIMDLAREYESWLHESYQVIKSEVIAQSKGLENLDEVFTLVFHGDLESVFGGTEGSVSENIYKAIYKNGLTFDMAKESILKGNWDREIVTQGKNVMFKDIIDGGDFHKFIESLRKLQNRTSIKTLRGKQAKFLAKAQVILKEVS